MVGRNGLTRDVLLRAFDEAGATGTRSYLTTGNVTFEIADPLDATFASRVEDCIEKVLGRREPIFIRTVEHLADLVESGPFAGVDSTAVHERCVTFLPSERPWNGQLPVVGRRQDVTVFAAVGADVFSTTRLVGGRPGTAGPLIEKATKVGVTTRNWNTIERMVRSPD